jgi:hypothetical protein
VLFLLALAAEARPGHGFQSSFGDRLLAGLTHPECASPDPSQGLFNRPQKMSIGPMHTDLKFRFSVRVGLVNEIAVPPACSWYKSFSAVSRSRQLVALG